MDSPTDLRPESMEQHGSMRTVLQGAIPTDPRMHAGQVRPSTVLGGWQRTSRAWTPGPVTPGPVRTQKDYHARAAFDPLVTRREEVARARQGVSRQDLHELATRVTEMRNELRYLRNLYDAMNARVQAATAQQPALQPSAGPNREPVMIRMGAASSNPMSNPRVSPTLEVTLPDDLWAEAETRDLLESLTRNM